MANAMETPEEAFNLSQNAQAESKELRGVGGWLAFFIVALVFLAPSIAFAQLAIHLSNLETIREYASAPHWTGYKASLWGTLTVGLLLNLYVGYCLWKRHVWASVHFTLWGLWVIRPAISIAGTLLAWQFFDPTTYDGKLSIIAGILVRPALSSGIWTAYLLRSKRVRNTYVRLSEEESPQKIERPVG